MVADRSSGVSTGAVLVGSSGGKRGKKASPLLADVDLRDENLVLADVDLMDDEEENKEGAAASSAAACSSAAGVAGCKSAVVGSRSAGEDVGNKNNKIVEEAENAGAMDVDVAGEVQGAAEGTLFPPPVKHLPSGTRRSS